MIDAYLRSQSDLDDRVIHLLFSANRWELVSQIEKSLREGTIVVCYRYAFSGIAFSASKGLPYEWCRAPDISLPSPDLVLFLDISPEKAKERGGYGEERYEKEEMQKRVREIFRRIGDEMSDTEDKLQWVVIDAGRNRDMVSKDIWNKVEVLMAGTSKPTFVGGS
ncbi:P-loop containing nucleoside triphosphate hydrolase protein [Dendrothele bispora CBS 962.96]|uniref:P-loop containing nucleoside triphosphate hydrolase protein n=1 Tax=Dendrothele bispora (strain CBS 962.96) TaxID=1314807 RepID=A0A4S8LP89_DENBC|nr:P-loop containing nucleoside triphosphate hydrolase protein [Dendrothele bispora CBS 962.96]